MIQWTRAERFYLRYLRRLFRDPGSLDHIEELADNWARDIVAFLVRENIKAWRIKAAESEKGRRIYLSLKRGMAEPLAPVVKQLVRRNAMMIRSLPREAAAAIGEFIARKQSAGLRGIALEKEAYKATPRLIKQKMILMARSEVSRAESALIRIRAENMGFGWYEWWTCRDERVRTSHHYMHGVLVNWSDPPAPEALVGQASTLGNYHVGEAPNCRCVPMPVLSLDDVSWPHMVHWRGDVAFMTRRQFSQLGGSGATYRKGSAHQSRDAEGIWQEEGGTGLLRQ